MWNSGSLEKLSTIVSDSKSKILPPPGCSVPEGDSLTETQLNQLKLNRARANALLQKILDTQVVYLSKPNGR